MDTLEISVPQIAEFLMCLSNQNCQIGYIRGYMSAILSMLEHKVRHIDRDKDLTGRLQSMSISRPIQARTVPAWGLSLVLGMLNGGFFKPLSSVDMKYLVAITSGCVL
jgi:hypothetical protein